MTVNPLLLAGMASFAISLILTPIFRDVFRSFRVVDEPDANRKVHVYPIPRVGGIAIAVSYFAVFYIGFYQDPDFNTGNLSIAFRVIPAAVVVFVTGLIDDFLGLKPAQKFFGQFAAAGLACWAGVRMTNMAGQAIPAVWDIPLTIVWLVLCTNAFNLVDGLDGLAAGVGLFATLTIFAAALIQGNDALAFAVLPLAGSLLGFLCFNFNPATVFLGDCGSLLIGFLLGCFGVIWTQKSLTLLGIATPIMAMSIPLLDVTLCIVRRWLRNKPVFSADRGHIHHRLLDQGLSPRQAVFVLYGLSSIAAIFSLAQSVMDNLYASAAIVVAFLIVVWVGVHKLRYTEFMLAGRLLRVRELQQGVSGSLTLSAFEQSLLKAKTAEECWDVLLRVVDTFGFSGVRLHLGSKHFQLWDPQIAAPGYWHIVIPLSQDGDRLELARKTGSYVLPAVTVPLVDLLSTVLSEIASPEAPGAAQSADEAHAGTTA